jgi:hypothetical protein
MPLFPSAATTMKHLKSLGMATATAHAAERAGQIAKPESVYRDWQQLSVKLKPVLAPPGK